MILLGHVDLPGEESSVPQARLYVRKLLEAADHTRVDDALLLVSELVTNSVRHSDSGSRPDGRITVVISHRPGALQVKVIDQGSKKQAPRMLRAAEDSDRGRGLWLVGQIASAWGVYEDDAGRAVWFELASA
ncbi:ATP-binding protein [Sphaerimonospora thailandensis]|uniref:ATP-binding protein n=1 Tax=Sphaerimonospora thailandensis TaxID=795644 RepID=UPI001950C78D|nr:ATP-binding protein [Sphaerimonospora thailandensis]